MKCEHYEFRTCPKCGKCYCERSSISREDNETLICPDCGTREALASIGVSKEEQEQILEIIHRNA
ncbi:MAG: hypothetical protein K2O42_00835 [Oscillospiraceae bacterium]|nr:hypothetical protein [Oscillospiraceae bacterium]MDE7120692.1 hypothetical protein [Oscillospiraceae bacterium]